jgi:hypothetical protein
MKNRAYEVKIMGWRMHVSLASIARVRLSLWQLSTSVGNESELSICGSVRDWYPLIFALTRG